MGDYLLNPKCPSVTNAQIKEEVLFTPTSPTSTVVQGMSDCGGGGGGMEMEESSSSSLVIKSVTITEQSTIRVRPLQALTCEKSPESSETEGRNRGTEKNSLALSLTNGKNVNAINSANWRVNCKSVKDKLKFILDNKDCYQDVTFVVGKNGTEKISAHKLILRLGSPILEKILCSHTDTALAIKNGQSKDNIEVSEVEPFAFKYMLKFMYTDVFDPSGLSSSDIMRVLQCSRVFEVHELAHLCVQSLKNHVHEDNAIALVEMGREIDDAELRDVAISYICRNVKKIFYSANFMELSYANLVQVIENDALEWDELSIFKSVVRWADEFCKRRCLEPVPGNLRGALGEIVYRIRFPLMTAEEFTFEVIPTKVLTSEEQVQIFKYLCLAGSMREQLEPTSFICRRRNHTLNKSDLKLKDETSDDGLLGKFKSESGESPHCQLALASNSDMTEAESEDTLSTHSRVSSHLSSPPTTKKRQRVRSHSPSPSPTPKYSQLFGKAPKRSKEKPNKIKKSRESIDPDKCIYWTDCEVELNQFTEELNANPNRREIESIRLSNVTVTDHDKLQERRVRLPKLKDFHLDIKLQSLTHSEVNSLSGELSLEHFLFFSLKVGKPNWFLNEIWSLGVNISLVINGITILNIDHDRNLVIINKLKDCAKIVESAQGGDSGLKSLVMSHQRFPGQLDSFPSQTLERLVLLSINQIPDFTKFIRKFKRLRELCILSTEPKKIDLTNDLLSKDKLRKLSMGSTKFLASSPTPMKNLEELFLWRCEWGSGFEENFPLLFPNLKKVSFFGGNKVSPRFMLKILKIKSVEEIGCGFFDWSTSNNEIDEINAVKEFLQSVGLSDGEKSFLLKKDNETGSFIGTKGSFEISQEEIYKSFQFYHLYCNYEVFRS